MQHAAVTKVHMPSVNSYDQWKLEAVYLICHKTSEVAQSLLLFTVGSIWFQPQLCPVLIAHMHTKPM